MHKNNKKSEATLLTSEKLFFLPGWTMECFILRQSTGVKITKTSSVQNYVEHNMPMKDYFVTLYVY